LFSRQCEYALQAVLYLSGKPKVGYTNINEISERLGVPMPFLGKTLQLLVKGKILSSLKGPNGGFRLERDPREVALFHVVDAIDGTGFMTSCVMGFPECSSKNPCPMHSEWAQLRDRVYQILATKTVSDISKEINDSRQLRSKLRLR
jgi:Rrf2 family iron-sulfur cluster assembly transcriptional regulator